MTTLVLMMCMSSTPMEAAYRRVEAAFAAARAVAKTRCGAETECRSLPMGSRACGGPQTHVVFCASTTDVAELERRVKAATRLEEAFNAAWRVGSACSVAPVPRVRLVDGACVAR